MGRRQAVCVLLVALVMSSEAVPVKQRIDGIQRLSGTVELALHGIRAIREKILGESERRASHHLDEQILLDLGKDPFSRDLMVTFILMVSAAFFVVVQPRIGNENSKTIIHKERECPTELGTQLMGRTLNLLPGQSHDVKVCKEEWTYNLSILNMFHLNALGNTDKRAQKSAFSWAFNEVEFGGCVPVSWLLMSGIGSVCATETNEEGEAIEFARCFKCDPCACTVDGTSGHVQTGLYGCDNHFVGETKHFAKFCYAVGGEDCPSATPSTGFPGAAFRECTDKDNHMARPEDGENDLGGDSAVFSLLDQNRGVLPFVYALVVAILFVCATWKFAALLGSIQEKKNNIEGGHFANLPEHEDTNSRLASLESTEWRCASGDSCVDFVSFAAGISQLASNPCANRFGRVVVPGERDGLLSENFNLEFACDAGCPSGCDPIGGWVPVQLRGRLLLDSSNAPNPQTRLLIDVVDETGAIVPNRRVTITDTDVTVGDSPAPDGLFSRIDQAGAFKATIPIFPGHIQGTPLVILTVVAADKATHKEYSIFRHKSFRGTPLDR